MSYFDLMLESEDQVMINKVIENATYQMCIEGGEAVIQDVEDYVDLLMTENYEPTPQFDEYMFESLSPYLEENAKYLGMFLFEGADDYSASSPRAVERREKYAQNKANRASASSGGPKKTSPAQNDTIIKNTRSDVEQAAQDHKFRVDEARRRNRDRNDRIGPTKQGSKVGLMQKVKNTFGGAKTEKQKAVGGIGSAMLKGLQNAKRSVGKGLQKVGGNKSGLLGKVASAGKNMVRSSNLAKANIMRANRGEGKKIPTTKKV